jgi:hypothetical protein
MNNKLAEFKAELATLLEKHNAILDILFRGDSQNVDVAMTVSFGDPKRTEFRLTNCYWDSVTPRELREPEDLEDYEY